MATNDGPEPRWPDIPHRRWWNIAFRTAHIATVGILLGGHFFDVEPDRLYPALGASIATGLALIVLEAYGSRIWLVQGRGVAVLIKLGLLCLVPLLWQWRVALLLTVLAIGSIGSHMPSRLRYYSWRERRVVTPRGPGFPGG